MPYQNSIRETFTELEDQIKKTGLAINQDKQSQFGSQEQDVKKESAGCVGYSFGQVDNLTYLGSLLSKHDLNSN